MIALLWHLQLIRKGTRLFLQQKTQVLGLLAFVFFHIGFPRFHRSLLLRPCLAPTMLLIVMTFRQISASSTPTTFRSYPILWPSNHSAPSSPPKTSSSYHWPSIISLPSLFSEIQSLSFLRLTVFQFISFVPVFGLWFQLGSCGVLAFIHDQVYRSFLQLEESYLGWFRWKVLA